jgi:MraZ protein
VADRGAYQGCGLALVDDKGRVAIPAALRATLAANAPKDDGKSGGTVVIATHRTDRCLIGYDQGYIEQLRAELTEQERAHTSADGEFNYNIKRRGAAAAEATPFDGSGRFIMPAFPRFRAKIGKHAFFWGVIDYFEIWDPETLLATEGAPDVMKDAVAFFLGEKGLAA